MNDKMNIFFASDKKYFPHLETAIASMLSNADVYDNFNIFILSNDLDQSFIDKLKLLNRIKEFNIELIIIDDSSLKKFHTPHYISSTTTFYRYFIPILKDNIDKALYLDSDIIVMKSLKYFYNIDLENNYIAGVEDPHPIVSNVLIKKKFHLDDRYVNAGALLFNCKKMREDNFTEKCLDLNNKLSKRVYFGADQDVINILTYKHKKILEPKYNLVSSFYLPQMYTEYLDKEMDEGLSHPIILHYSDSEKPWDYRSFPKREEDFLYHKYAKLTTSYDKNFLLKASIFNPDLRKKLLRIRSNLFIKLINSIFTLTSDILGLILYTLLIPKYYFKYKRQVKW